MDLDLDLDSDFDCLDSDLDLDSGVVDSTTTLVITNFHVTSERKV